MSAFWITGGECPDSGNVFLFRKEIPFETAPAEAGISITAGSWYRLKVNGVWICDGPGRFLPEHTSFDRVELSSLFHRGNNIVEVTSPGELWCSIAVVMPDGSRTEIGSDRNWSVLPLPLRVSGTCECSDNSRLPGNVAAAREVCGKEEGKWKDFQERSCRMLTRREFLLTRFVSACRIDSASGEKSPCPVEDIRDPAALIYPDFDCTVLNLAEGYELELCYDSGEENVGCWSMVLFAAAGTVVELCSAGIEKITWICREGWNRFTSMIRCRGRFLFLTVSGVEQVVRIQSLRLAESAYPMGDARFACSDYRLAKAFDVSRRTLKLCMEDTFCDVLPWGENCRNEILFALSCGGAYDFVRRNLRLGGAGNSPVTWIIALGDYYDETGDNVFLREMWQPLRRSLDGALTEISPETGLAGKDIRYNFFLAGALQTADRLSRIVGDMGAAYDTALGRLKETLCRLWDPRNLAWPESMEQTGCFPVDINALAVLFDIVPEEFASAVRANVLSPRQELEVVRTPAGLFNYCLALEKLDAADRILPLLMENISPMLDAGETAYPCACCRHSHAGEAALLYFLPRLTLGLVPERRAHFTVSPFIAGLEWSSGTRMTPAGAIGISWRKNGRILEVSLQLPEEVTAELKPNITTQGYEIVMVK